MTSRQRLNIYLNNLKEKAEEQSKLLEDVQTTQKKIRKDYLDWKNQNHLIEKKNYLIEKKYRSALRKSKSIEKEVFKLIEENELKIISAEEEKIRSK